MKRSVGDLARPIRMSLAAAPRHVGVLERGAKKGVFRAGIDPLDVYLTMAALGFFYLSNRWTLSTVFRRDLVAKREIARWGEYMTGVVLSSLGPAA